MKQIFRVRTVQRRGAYTTMMFWDGISRGNKTHGPYKPSPGESSHLKMFLPLYRRVSGAKVAQFIFGEAKRYK